MENNLKKGSLHHEVTEDEMRGINWSRESMVGIEMNVAKAKEWLRNINLPNSPNFFTCITKGENPPLIRVRRGVYVVNPKPIHIDMMRKVWSDYADYGKKQPKPEATAADVTAAIELLKGLGYRVLKPITEYEEV